MFDDYVEHATSLPILQNKAHPQFQFQGFEPSPYPPDDFRVDAQLSPEPELDSAVPKAPIFDLGRVQYDLPADLVSLAVSSDVLVMGLVTNIIVVIELSHADQVVKVQIPRPTTSMSIYKLFMDPSGRHIIITSTQGENWYLFRTWKKPRQLKGFKMTIESVAWNKSVLLSSPSSTSTREILLGTRNGIIYEAILNAEEDFFKSVERHLQPVFSLPERPPITGLRFEFFPPPAPTKALVVVTTPTRIYQFIGPLDKRSEDGRVFSTLFNTYQDTAPKISELPGDIPHSQLTFYTPTANQASSLPSTLAWLTAQGVYHGSISFSSNSDDFIDGPKLLAYPTTTLSPHVEHEEPPLAIALTEFHFVLLFKDRITSVGILDSKVTYEEVVPVMRPEEEVRGMTVDPIRGTYWVYTSKSLFELDISNEARDVWKIFLELGQYETALRYSKSAGQRDHVLSAQADTFFNQGRFFQAAQCYAQCSASFEEVTLKFIDVGERDSLRSYLISRLERTHKTDLTQRMMLATWLVEFYLSKCNDLEDIIASESISQDVDNLKAEKAMLEDDLRHFFETYKSNLDAATIYGLTQNHGRIDMYLYYATVNGDLTRVVEHWSLEEEWLKAIEVINGQSDLELYYRFASVLIRNAPKDTVDSWLRQPALDPIRLVPALLQLQTKRSDPSSPNHAARYLNCLVFERGDTSSTIHNLLVTCYVSPRSSSDDDGPLLHYLSNAPADPLTSKPYYDLDYALRLCKKAGRIQPCVHIYSKMGLYENSVELALQKGDVELAKINADMPEDDQQLRKKLWLKIARYVVQDKQDIKAAMRFLENTDLIKIEDILPFFPDFVVIDDFKEEIAHALEGYSAHIDTLKQEMDDATQTAESIKNDIAALKNRFLTIDAGEQCSSCSQLLLTRQFYVFPCMHTFHADCLIGLAKEYLPAHALRKIVALQDQLMKGSGMNGSIGSPASQHNTLNATPVSKSTQRSLISASFGNPLQNGAMAAVGLGKGILSAGDRLRDLIVPDALAAVVSTPNWIPGIGGTKKGEVEKMLGGKKAEKLRAELDDLLASNCPLCDSVVVGLDKPFIKEGEVDNTWTL